MRTIRAAAHVHSDWSYDGTFPLGRIAAEFRRRGYDAVLLAEHDATFDADRHDAHRAACARASLPGCALIPGIEYSDPDNVVHIPVWGPQRFLGAGRATDDLLALVAEHGGFAVLAHPGRRDAIDVLAQPWAAGLGGAELWNRKYDGVAPNPAAAAALAQRPALVPFVGLDLHTARQFHPLAMVLELDGAVTEENVVDALRAGRARPAAFGRDAHEFVHGPAGAAVRSLERGRRRVAPLARAIRALNDPPGWPRTDRGPAPAP